MAKPIKTMGTFTSFTFHIGLFCFMPAYIVTIITHVFTFVPLLPYNNFASIIPLIQLAVANRGVQLPRA